MNITISSLSVLFLVILLASTACQSTEDLTETVPPDEHEISHLQKMIDTSAVFNSNVTGFVLFDPAANSTIYSLNGDKYFTPASNTKLFTFYAGLKALPENLRALEYVIRGDSLIFWGTADPSFLHREYDSDTVYDFLQNRSENLYYSDAHYQDEPLGAGWSWDDYNSYYSAEKSPFPMYGNMVEFTVEEIEINRIKQNEEGFQINPDVFRKRVQELESNDDMVLNRERTGNEFKYHARADTTIYEILKPFHYTPKLITEMLADTLGKPVEYIELEKPSDTEVLYSVASDTAYKRMLQPSDNFIAEQLILMIASERDQPMNTGNVIEYITKKYLTDLPDEPQWADGSGLSRYNMFTPRSIVRLLQKIDEEFENDEQMFELFPAGGESGTIESWYANRDGGEPYVFAKTGTLMNNHCLSGFIVTRNGRKLLFSFMNNHYVTSSSVVKEEMEKVLWYIYNVY